MDDKDFWHKVKPEHIWVTDKLMLAKKLGYVCGPAGVNVPNEGVYIVRPCVNYRMMSRGAKMEWLYPDDDEIPDGYFWCEVFEGRHLSFDYRYGKQVLGVEGFRDTNDLNRFSRWTKITDTFTLPPWLQEIADENEWLNVEVIGDKIIEVHFRFNDDFHFHDATTIIPVWKDRFYKSECGDRLGFILQDGSLR